MNRTYRIVWSQVSNTWIAVAENARGRGKSTAGPRLVAAALALAGVSWGMPSALAASAADATVVGGAGSVSQHGATTTINQSSQKMAIDWTSLSTAANEALVFNQPNASAIALNRITGSSPSTLLGSLTANGHVFILNPNGVLFGAGAQVNVGGLVASTLTMNPADFMAGGSTFTKDPAASGSVVNQGTITAGDGGYAALVGGTVRNEGTITTPLGTALLVAGDKVTLNLNNGSLIGYSIDQGALHALVENKQLIQADGGQVLMSAKALDQLSTAVINNTGVIEARTVQNKNGRIMLMGDMNVGTVNVGGTLDASAPDGGDGGFIETSAAHVKVVDTARITTRAEAGKTGQWLIDPFDFVVASSGGDMTGAALGSQLENNNVTLTTTEGSTGTDGDLSINDAVAWSAANTLTLVGERDVNVNANLTYSGSGAAGVTVQAVRDINVGANAAITSSGTGALNVTLGGPTAGTAAGGAINMGSASSIATNGGDVSFKAASIKLAGASVAAAGGNIAMTAAGTSASHSLEIADVSGTRSNVSTTGAGTITLSGSLTSGGASATGGSAGGVVVTNSSITSDTGAIAITGHAGGVSTGSQIERGFRLDAGTLITSAGNITLTGSVIGNQALTPYTYGQDSMGGQMASGATVSSTGGNVALSGTFNNIGHYGDPAGLAVGGKVQSGAGGKVTLSGDARVGVFSSGGDIPGGGGIGLSTGASSEIVAGTGGLDITGTVHSSSPSSNLFGVRLSGAASATGNIAVTGTSQASSAYGVTALRLTGGTLAGLGTATITLRGSGVPAPAHAGNYDVNVVGTTVSTAGGEISVIGDRMNIGSTINSGSGRTVIATHTASRDITLNGAGSEQLMLNLSSSELDQITASVLQLGGGAYSGDISIGDNGSATTMTSTPALSLVTTGSITQTAGLTVNSLNAVGSSVTLTNAANQISNISGIATSGSFQATSTSGLTVGTVDGVSGINSAGKVLVQTTGASADLTLASAVTAASTANDSLVLVAGRNININAGITNTSSTGGLTATAATGSLKVSGSAISAAGGNISLSATGGSDTHSVEITNNGATRSSISTTGTGTITLSGSLTGGGASATGGSAGGVVITGSDITTDTGAITITGHAGGASTGGQIERGFRLDSGTLITSAGNIGLTGTVSGNQRLEPHPYINLFNKSVGGAVANGATVSSTGGNVSLSGTLTNIAHYNGTGLAMDGKVQSGAGNKVTLTGVAKVGTWVVVTGGNGAGTGLSTGMLSEVVAGTGGLDITGTVDASISTNLIGASLAGIASSTGNIAVTGTSLSSGASGVTGLYLTGGTLAGLGTATITLRGSGVPAPAPAGNYDVNVAGTSVSTAGGQISVIGNRVNIQSPINSGSGRTVIATHTASRPITLNDGMSGSETWGLNLSSSELNQITASVLQLGGGAYSGDISFGNGVTTMTSTPALSLVTTGSITQTGGLTVNSLNAVGSSVTLTNANNQISNISGIATSGSFQAASASGLTVGTVDGVSGINSAGKVLVRTTGASADLTLDSAVTAASTANDALVLVAGRNFINNVGAAALQIPGTARWQVWSANPANDSRNNLDYDFKQYNASYGTTTVAQSTGNGFFYTLAPTITSALTGTVSKTYDTATAATLTAANFSAAAGAVDGDTVSLNTSTTGTYNNKNAGTGKTVTATGVSIASTTNGSKSVYGYTLGSASGNIGTITQAGLAVNGISAADKVYDAGTTAALTGTAAISALGSDVLTLGGTGVGTFVDKNVGTNKAVAVSGYTLSGADAGNYALVQPAGVTATITQASLAVSGISAVDKVYDANTTAALTGAAAVSVLGGDVVTVAGTGTGTFTDKNVGTAKAVAVSGYTLSGADAGNYAVVQPAGLTANITPKALGYSTIAASKTYDGTTVATFSGAGLNGVVGGDTVALSQSGSFSDKNVANGKTVSYVSSLSGNDAGNYVIASNSGTTTADITAATLTVSGTTAANKTYDGTTAATVSGGALSGVISGDNIALSQSGAFSDKNAAIGKTVVIANSLSGSEAGNYVVLAGTTTADITAATLTVSGTTAADKTYDATTSATLSGGALSGVVVGDIVALSQNGAFSDKNAATGKTVSYASSLFGSDSGNYVLASSSGTTTADVTATTLTVSGTTAANKTYDGTIAATLGGGALSGLVSGDSVALSQSGTFSDKNAATGKTVSYASSLSGTDAGNYVLASANGTATADITPAPLTVAANSANKFYDGLAYTDNNGVTISGLVNGETVADLSGSLGYGGSSQGAIGIGNYAITPGGLSSANYQMHFVDGVLTIKLRSQTSAALGGPALEPAYDPARQTVAGQTHQSGNPSGQDAKVLETSTLGAGGNGVSNGGVEDITPRLTLAGCGVNMPAPSDCQ